MSSAWRYASDTGGECPGQVVTDKTEVVDVYRFGHEVVLCALSLAEFLYRVVVAFETLERARFWLAHMREVDLEHTHRTVL